MADGKAHDRDHRGYHCESEHEQFPQVDQVATSENAYDEQGADQQHGAR
jgi:hypothetical protein